ncbi:MAG: glutamyl-tRNA reductase [Aureispira sp.]|nr:glutamyl-tRNA reductase [Aureispira sp.]
MDTLSSYKVLTITHKHTQLKEIGQYVLDAATPDALKARLEAIKQALGLQELLYLATCNRVMFFFVTPARITPKFRSQFFETVYPQLSNQNSKDLEEPIHAYAGEEAIRHLFTVSGSIDSLVVGEREILRQLRDAYSQCSEWKLTGDSIRLAMRYSVEVAKRIYSRTRIGEKPVSIVSLAIRKLLSKNVAKDARFLLVGAGQTNSLVAKFLKKYSFQNFTVFNRSIQRAESLAAFLEGDALPLTELNGYSHGFDVLIVCTGATEPLVTTELYKKLLDKDGEHKVVIDLGIPNNVDKAIVEDHDVTYIEIEGLKEMARANLAFREQEVTKAAVLLEEEIELFKTIFKERQVERALRDVPTQIKAIKNHALSNVFQKEFDTLDQTSQELVERMMEYMERRCIAIPLQVAKAKLID